MIEEKEDVYVKPDCGPSFGIREMLIFCSGYFEERKGEMRSPGKEKLSEALGVGRQSLNKYLLDLRKEDIIREERPRGPCGYILTKEGWAVYEKLYERMAETNVTPEIHGCEGKLRDTISSFKDPMNIMRVVHAVMTGSDLNISALYGLEQIHRPGHQDAMILQQLVDDKGNLDMPFELMLDRYTISGKGPSDLPSMDSEGSIQDAILLAEVLRKRGDVPRARAIFRKIAYQRSGGLSAYRIFSIVGLINCTKALEGENIALSMVDDLLPTMAHPSHIVMLKKCKADLLMFSKYDEALGLYYKCLRSLNRLKHPSLETAIYNNMGIPYLEKGDWSSAERSWRKALRIAKENRYIWIEAVTKLNIADALAHSGKCQRARKVLSESKRFFVSVGDEEGMSMYHFNMALVCIEEGNKEGSLDHFQIYENFPFTYIGKKRKLQQVYYKRFTEKGWGEPIPPITDGENKKG